ncbi:protein hold'em [Drosophila sulfurigaster albostrigata]|uniref:protein hold'em n=1 Tax=Drosophila sulfurigaster albostrigata TaxID=89887 RepID=UPI002D21A0FB|nr:protein hold'em [Drosophila sulfurigaster albostrigata]
MSASKFKTTKHLHLIDMHPTMTNFSTVALIIAKSEPHIFLDKLSSEKRGVINFTLRDTKRHIANCKCWSSEASVHEYNAMLQMGDVVDIVGAKVMAITPPLLPSHNGFTENRYQPSGTLSCALVVNEGHGYLVKHSSDDQATLQALLQLCGQSHKALSTALKLRDVRCVMPGGEQRPAAFVDLFVAVATMPPVRELKRKQPRNGSTLLQCLELVVIDTSCASGMMLTLWHVNWIRRAQRWQAGKTLLHLIDVRVAHSQFHGCSVLSHASCTLIYENPEPTSPEAQALLAFAAKTPLNSFELCAQSDVENLPPAAEIQTQMTVRQIYARAEGELQDSTSEHFTAVLYAMVSKFDIDGLGTSINKKCKSCRRLIPSNRSECDNEHCQLEFSLEYSGARAEKFFNINIHLSDHTGTLVETRLSGGVANQLLGLNADAFELLSDRKKTELKWRFLLKHFEVKLLIKKPTPVRKNLTIIVVDMELTELEQIIQKLAAF